MSCLIAGCDPGLSGATAFLFDDRKPEIMEMPIATGRREIDGMNLLARFEHYCPGLVIAEDLHGPASFKLGAAMGSLIVSVLAGRFRLERVAPRTWQAHFGVKSKQESIDTARRIYPDAPLIPPGKRAPKHDRADALLIAHYGLVHYVRP